MSQSVIEIRNIEVRRGSFRLSVEELSLDRAEFLVVVGPSGSGKSTLLDAISGRASVQEGRIWIEQRLMNSLPPHQRPVHTCWQVGGESLFPHLTVAGNVEFALRVRGVEKALRRREVEKHLTALGLEGYEQRSITQLSGGERQRVAIARTLAARAPVVLLDEVTTGLDPELRHDLRKRLVEISQRETVAMLYVSHDLDEAEELSRVTGGRVLILRGGEVQQWAPWNEIYERPANAFTARYVGPINLLEGRWHNDEHFEVPELGRLPIPVDQSAVPVSEKVLYGIRPEAIELTIPPAADAFFVATVEALEPDRGAFDLHLRCGELKLLARTWRNQPPLRVGVPVGLRWPAERCFLVPRSP